MEGREVKGIMGKHRKGPTAVLAVGGQERLLKELPCKLDLKIIWRSSGEGGVCVCACVSVYVRVSVCVCVYAGDSRESKSSKQNKYHGQKPRGQRELGK